MSKEINSQTLGSLDRINNDFKVVLFGMELVGDKPEALTVADSDFASCLGLMFSLYRSLHYISDSLTDLDRCIRSEGSFEYRNLYY